ncbi:hypothetical protein Tco_1282848 [Tanacetum coccineum]
MFYRKNVDYPELIWEDFAFQIDHKKEKKSRSKTMLFPRFTKDDGIVSRLKFVRIREDYQEYRLPIHDIMMNDKIKQSESYKMFIKYSTGQIHPKKSRGKGSKGKKNADSSKLKPAASKLKLKGVQSLTPKEQEAADTMQALKESKKTSRRQPGTRGSSEGTSRILGVPDESTVIYAISSEGTDTKPGVLYEEKVTYEVNVILEWGSENESEHSDDSQLNFDDEEKKDNDGDADDEGDDHNKIQVHKDMDVEMKEAKTVKRENKENDEMTDAAKLMLKRLQKKRVILSVLSGFDTHFLNLSSDGCSYPTRNPTDPVSISTQGSCISDSGHYLAKLEKDVSELKKIDHFAEVLASLKSQVPIVVEHYLGSKIGDDL